MGTGEKIIGVILLFLILALIGIFVYNIISDYRDNEANCIIDAKALGVSGKYENGICRLMTPEGVWLDELQYLLVYATNKCP